MLVNIQAGLTEKLLLAFWKIIYYANNCTVKMKRKYLHLLNNLSYKQILVILLLLALPIIVYTQHQKQVIRQTAQVPPPSSVFTPITGATIYIGSTYNERATDTDPNATSLTGTVDYGDGTTEPIGSKANIMILSHTYRTTGTFTVSGTVSDNVGNSTTFSAEVWVRPPGYTITFTPLVGGNVAAGSPYDESGKVTNPNGFIMDGTVDYGDGTGIQPLSLNNYVNPTMNFELYHSYANVGTYTVTATVFDNAGGYGTATTTVTVYQPITKLTVLPFEGATINPGDTYQSFGSVVDPNAPTTPTVTVDYGDGSGVQPLTLSKGTKFTLDHVYNTAGKFTVTVSASNTLGDTASATATVTVGGGTNPVPLTVSQLNNASLNEGQTYTATGSFTDPNATATTWNATVDYGDGSGTQPLSQTNKNFSLSHMYKDNGTYTVTVNVSDNLSQTGSGTALVTVNNVNPTIGAITPPAGPAKINTTINTSASFNDAGVLDTHTASWNWGDGITTTGTVTEANGSGTVTGTHTYSKAGLFNITLTVTDKDGGVASATYQYVVIYNPSAGTLQGTGIFKSLAGFDKLNPKNSGNAVFGFTTKYGSKATTPSGAAVISFQIGKTYFYSSSFQWLVINGSNAWLKGTGKLNNSGSYTIFISSINGRGSSAKIRIKIINNANNTVVYDTQTGAADTAAPTTPLSSGSISVYK